LSAGDGRRCGGRWARGRGRSGLRAFRLFTGSTVTAVDELKVLYVDIEVRDAGLQVIERVIERYAEEGAKAGGDRLFVDHIHLAVVVKPSRAASAAGAAHAHRHRLSVRV
jgi:hypothetical protein